jgi:hypothetical protein
MKNHLDPIHLVWIGEPDGELEGEQISHLAPYCQSVATRSSRSDSPNPREADGVFECTDTSSVARHRIHHPDERDGV